MIKQRKILWVMLLIGGFLQLSFIVNSSYAELNENCTVSILNRTVQVAPDGSWKIDNVPANFGLVRARVTCIEDGITKSGQSEFFTIEQNIVNGFDADIILGDVDPIPLSLSISSPTTTLTSVGETAQLSVTAHFPDESTKDITFSGEGTNYLSSNNGIANVGPNGLVTAVSSGTILISALNDGVLGMMTLQVSLSGDSDNDGIPDDLEIANGLDSENPVDALEDFDSDGLTNFDELINFGTDINNDDTDEDGIKDGEEVILGDDGFITSPLLADTDSDGIRDLLEIQTNTDPTNSGDFNLALALQELIATPNNVQMTFNTIIGESSIQLTVQGLLIDGTSIDLSSTAKGTNYSSSDLNICNFGSPDGRIFAGSDGLCIITVSNSGFSDQVTVVVNSFAPTALSFVELPGTFNNVDVNGNHAYVAAGANGLIVVDTTDRSNPQIVGSLNTAGSSNDVKVLGDICYVADGVSGLQIIDVSNPTSPAILSSFNTAGSAQDLFIQDNICFVADGSSGLQIIDITEPLNPVLISTYGTSNSVQGVSVNLSSGLAVLAKGTTGIEIVNIADLMNPAFVSAIDTGNARDVEFRGNFVFVADHENSFTSVDILNPTSPIIKASLERSLAGLLQDVAIIGPLAFGADIFFVNGIPVIGIEDPANPAPRAIINFSGFRDDEGSGIAVDSSHVYLTANKSGTGRLYIGQYVFELDDQGIPPSVSIVSPDNGVSVLEGTNLEIEVVAEDDIGVQIVSLLIDGEIVTSSAQEPYTFEFQIPAGSVSPLTFSARASDFGENTSVSNELIVFVEKDSIPPVVNLLVPTDNDQLIENQPVDIQANASDNFLLTSVEIIADGNTIFNSVNGPYEVNYLIPLGASELTIEIIAIDFSGNITRDIQTFIVLPDMPPTVLITAPNANQIFLEGEKIFIHAEADDDVRVESVKFLMNGELIFTDTGVPYQVVDFSIPPIDSPSTLITFQAIAMDNLGQETATPLRYVLVEQDLNLPSIFITNIKDGQGVPKDVDLAINVEASDNVSVEDVEFLVNGELILVDSDVPYEASYVIPPDTTALNIEVITRDPIGNVASQSVDVTVHDGDPYTKLLLHLDGQDGQTFSQDESLSDHPIFFRFNAGLSEEQKAFGSTSLLLNGILDHVILPDSDDWNFGILDWTIDFWIYINEFRHKAAILEQNSNRSGDWWAVRLEQGDTRRITFEASVGSMWLAKFTSKEGFLPSGEWIHVAFSRKADNVYVFINGVDQTGEIIAVGGLPDYRGALFVGRSSVRHRNFNGYIDEIRISKGVTRWIEGFSVFSHAVQFGNLSPEATIFSPDTLNTIFMDPEDSQVFQVEGIDPNLDSVSIIWLVDGELADSGSPTFTYNPVDSPRRVTGDHIIEGLISDSLLIADNSPRWQVNVTNQAPVINGVTPDNSIPVVMDEGKSLEFTIDASDPDFDGLRYIWEVDGIETIDTEPMFTYRPDFDSAGPHVIQVSVSDEIDITGPVAWSIDVTDVTSFPIINITSPTLTTEIVEDQTIPIVVLITENIGAATIEIVINGDSILNSSNPPFETNYRVPLGIDDIAIEVFASDESGQVNDIHEIFTVLPDPPPTVIIVLPNANENFFEGEKMLIHAEAGDNVRVESVEFFVDGEAVLIDTSAPYQVVDFQVPVITDSTLIAIEALATDNLGHQTLSQTRFVSILQDNTLPSVSILGLIDGQGVASGHEILLKAEASDDISITSFEFLVNNEIVFQTDVEPFQFEYTVPEEGDILNIEAKAFDPAGNVNSDLIQVTVHQPDAFTKLLLHFDGLDGDMTSMDSSLSEHPISFHFDAHLSVDQKRMGSSSVFMDHYSDHLAIPDSDDWNFSGEDWTMDFWLYMNSFRGRVTILEQISEKGGGDWWGIRLIGEVNPKITFEASVGSIWFVKFTSLEGLIHPGEWMHFSISKQDDKGVIFINGVDRTGETIAVGGMIDYTNRLLIGGSVTRNTEIEGGNFSFDEFDGYIDELRISKGVARWANDFTVPANPYAVFLGNHVPFIDLASPDSSIIISMESHESRNFNIEISDSDFDETFIAWLVDGNVIQTGNTLFTYNPVDYIPRVSGDHTVEVLVSDSLIVADNSPVWSVNVINKAPVIESHDPDSALTIIVAENESADFSIVANDPDQDGLSYLWSLDGVDIDNNQNSFTYSPDFDAAGNHVLEGRVTDGIDIVGPVTWNIEVTNTNRIPGAPIIGINPSNPLTTDNLTCDIITPSEDPDGDTVTYSFQWFNNSQLESDLTTDTVPSERTAKHETWQCIATPNDGEDNGFQAQIETTILNSAPGIVSVLPSNASNITINEGDSQLFEITAVVEPDGDSISYRWDLDGRVLGDLSSFEYIPDSRASGAHTITSRVFDNENVESTVSPIVWNIDVQDTLLQPFVLLDEDFVPTVETFDLTTGDGDSNILISELEENLQGIFVDDLILHSRQHNLPIILNEDDRFIYSFDFNITSIDSGVNIGLFDVTTLNDAVINSSENNIKGAGISIDGTSFSFKFFKGENEEPEKIDFFTPISNDVVYQTELEYNDHKLKAGNDEHTLLLLHMDGAHLDSPGVVVDSSFGGDESPHTVSYFKFGTVPEGSFLSNSDPVFGGTSLFVKSGESFIELLRVDASNDFLDLWDSNEWTIDFWLKIPSGKDMNRAIFQHGLFSFNKPIRISYSPTNELRVSMQDTNNITQLDMSYEIVFDGQKWNHIAVEKYEGLVHLYVDGEVKIMSAPSGLVGDFLSILSIGVVSRNNTNSEGFIDEFRISDISRYGGENFDVPARPYAQLETLRTFALRLFNQGYLLEKIIADFEIDNAFFDNFNISNRVKEPLALPTNIVFDNIYVAADNGSAQAPIVFNLFVELNINTELDIVLSGMDINGDEFNFEVVDVPLFGILSLINEDQVTYTPNLDFVGTDSFTYKAVDSTGLSSDPAAVEISVVQP